MTQNQLVAEAVDTINTGIGAALGWCKANFFSGPGDAIISFRGNGAPASIPPETLEAVLHCTMAKQATDRVANGVAYIHLTF